MSRVSKIVGNVQKHYKEMRKDIKLTTIIGTSILDVSYESPFFHLAIKIKDGKFVTINDYKNGCIVMTNKPLEVAQEAFSLDVYQKFTLKYNQKLTTKLDTEFTNLIEDYLFIK